MATASKRGYLPRSTMDYSAIRGVYEYAEKRGVSFGKALEEILLESKSFNESLDRLSNGSEWFKNDVEEFKKSVTG